MKLKRTLSAFTLLLCIALLPASATAAAEATASPTTSAVQRNPGTAEPPTTRPPAYLEFAEDTADIQTSETTPPSPAAQPAWDIERPGSSTATATMAADTGAAARARDSLTALARAADSALAARPTVAVVDFTGENVPAGAARILTNRVRSDLFRISAFRLVEREAMNEILAEQGFQQAGCTAGDCTVQMGKLLGVTQIVTGSVTSLGSTFSINARLVSVETGEVIRTATYDHRGEIEGLLSQGTYAVALGLSPAQASHPGAAPTATVSGASGTADGRNADSKIGLPNNGIAATPALAGLPPELQSSIHEAAAAFRAQLVATRTGIPLTDWTPVRLSILPELAAPQAKNIVGFSLNLIYGESENLLGAELGLVNSVTGQVTGYQQGVYNQAGRFTGWQAGALNSSESLVGYQSGFINLIQQGTGVQWGLFNRSEQQFTGFQLGVINQAGKMHGIQIGLWNTIGTHSTPLINLDL
jgi:TolB-like protein